jgi:hypothetical protein
MRQRHDGKDGDRKRSRRWLPWLGGGGAAGGAGAGHGIAEASQSAPLHPPSALHPSPAAPHAAPTLSGPPAPHAYQPVSPDELTARIDPTRAGRGSFKPTGQGDTASHIDPTRSTSGSYQAVSGACHECGQPAQAICPHCGQPTCADCL